MKKFKDFLYDKNDLIIALLILVAATLIIIWRMDTIMEYPKTLISDTASTSTETDVTDSSDENEDSSAQSSSDEESSSDNDDAKTSVTSDNDDSQPLWSHGVLSREITVNVSGLSASEAVQCLVDAGLFTDYEEYKSVCAAAGLDHQKISAGSFTFSKGSSKTNIAGIVNWG